MEEFALIIFGSSAIGAALEALSAAKKQKMLYAIFFALFSVTCAVIFGIGISPRIPTKLLIYILSR